MRVQKSLTDEMSMKCSTEDAKNPAHKKAMFETPAIHN